MTQRITSMDGYFATVDPEEIEGMKRTIDDLTLTITQYALYLAEKVGKVGPGIEVP